MLFIIVWKVVGELHSLKNMMSGSKSPWFMEKESHLPFVSFLESDIVEAPVEAQGGKPLHIAQPGEHVRDQQKWVGVLYCYLVQLLVVLH